jgi:hypothetical protein
MVRDFVLGVIFVSIVEKDLLMQLRRNKMAKNREPKNAYEYTDWLYNTNRLTAEEHLELKRLLIKLEDGLSLNDVGC